MSKRGRKRARSLARKPCGRLLPDSSADHGSPRLVIVVEETSRAGVHRARVAAECLLDLLLQEGSLGPPRSKLAALRHQSGIEVRGLWEIAYSARVVAGYQQSIAGEESELPWRSKCKLARLAKRLGDDWALIRSVCVDQIRPHHPEPLRAALDRLGNWV